MSRTMSRAQRQAAFLESAARMYDQLEDWYDKHPDAPFGEIEAQARQYRLKLMGETMALVINGRTEGYQLEAPSCAQCGHSHEVCRLSAANSRGPGRRHHPEPCLLRLPSLQRGDVFSPWTYNSNSVRIIGVKGPRAWPPAWDCKASRSTWPPKAIQTQWVRVSQGTVCGG